MAVEFRPLDGAVAVVVVGAHLCGNQRRRADAVTRTTRYLGTRWCGKYLVLTVVVVSGCIEFILRRLSN